MRAIAVAQTHWIMRGEIMHSLFRGLCVVGAATAVLGGVSHAQAADPLVFQVPGNPTCESFLTNIGPVTEFKIDPPASGTFPAGTGTITVTVAANQKSLSWTSANVRINCMVVKGGPLGANIYYYGENGSTGDTGLMVPGGHNISHYTYAFGLEGEETPPEVGFVECIFNETQLCEALGNEFEGAVIYIFNPFDPFKQFAFEGNGVVGPSRCVCGVELEQCSPESAELVGNEACISETTPANAQTVILELQAIEGSDGDPCITIGGTRVCEK